MSDLGIDPTGPEANNARAAAFENQLVGIGQTLGWQLVCRNIDFFIKHNGGAHGRGVDVLWAIPNPRTGRREGLVGEAKVHGKQADLSTLQQELQTLHDKIHGFSGQAGFWKNARIAGAIDELRWGLLSHRTMDYDDQKARHHLLNVELKDRQRGPNAPAVFFAGPETLEAFADGCALTGRPISFYWPPTAEGDGEWQKACPPVQLATGILAYKLETGSNVLWLRDTLTDKDPDALAEIAHAWRINFETVIASRLTREIWRTVAGGWEQTAQRTRSRKSGHLPKAVEARNLGHSRLNRFDEQWPNDE